MKTVKPLMIVIFGAALLFANGIYSPDGKYLLDDFGKSIKLFEAKTGFIVREIYNGEHKLIDYSHNGKQVAFGVENAVAVVDAESGKEYKKFDIARPVFGFLGFSCNDDYICYDIADKDGYESPSWPGIINIATGEKREFNLKMSSSQVRNVDVSPDGKLLAVCYAKPNNKYLLVVLDIASQKVVFKNDDKVNGEQVFSVYFTPDGKLLMGEIGNCRKFFSVDNFDDKNPQVGYGEISKTRFGRERALYSFVLTPQDYMTRRGARIDESGMGYHNSKYEGVNLIDKSSIIIHPVIMNKVSFNAKGETVDDSSGVLTFIEFQGYEKLNDNVLSSKNKCAVLQDRSGCYTKLFQPNASKDYEKLGEEYPEIRKQMEDAARAEDSASAFFLTTVYDGLKTSEVIAHPLTQEDDNVLGGVFHDVSAIERFLACLNEKHTLYYQLVKNNMDKSMSLDKELEVDPQGHAAEVMDIAFTSDGKTLVSAARDKTIRIWDVESGENIKTIRGFTGPGENGSLYRLVITPDDKTVAVGGFFDDKGGSHMGDIRFFDIKTGKMIGVISKALNCISALSFSRDGSRLAFGSTDGFIRTMKNEFVKGTLNGTDYGTQVTSNAFSLGDPVLAAALSPDGDKFVGSIEKYKNPVLFDISTVSYKGEPRSAKELKGHHEREIVAAAFTPDGKYFLTADANKAMLWDSEGNFVRVFADVVMGSLDGDIAFSKDGSRVLMGTAVYDYASGRKISELPDCSHKVSAFSSTNIAANATGNLIHLWNPDSGKILKTLGTRFLKFYGIAFSKDGLKLAVSRKTGFDSKGVPIKIAPSDIISSFDFQTLKIFQNDSTPAFNNLKFERNGVTLARPAMTKEGSENMAMIEFGSVRINKDANLGIAGAFTLLPSGDALVATENNLRSYGPDGGMKKEYVGHSSGVTSLALSPDGKYFASFGYDNKICLWSLADVNSTVRPLATLSLFSDGEWICLSKYNYYASSRRGAKYFGFHVNRGINEEARFYPCQQYDAQLNRPDLVLKFMGMNNPDLEKAFYAAYLKRLGKLGLNQITIGIDFNLPSVKILTQAHTSSNCSDSIAITAEDKLTNLSRINMRINDVPVNGSEGISLKENPTKLISRTIRVTLSQGLNKIRVSVMNEKGRESLFETVTILNNAPQVKTNTYVITIGVSDYSDTSYNLKYAAKDASDFAKLYQPLKTAKVNDQVKVLKILDKEATREGILKARGFLENSKVDDKVIVFFAGHGLLDSKLDYYLATTDIDFDHPSARGLVYSDLEGLLDGIPARNKLLLIDACHSGEVDKDAGQPVADNSAQNPNVKSRGLKKTAGKRVSSIGLGNSFELMQSLFADFNNGSGTMIISSASGNEYAFESPKWNNGVFTYSVLEGLNSKNADRNKDGKITVSELRDYVSDKVQSLTQGKQHPTSRKENLEFDFKVQ